MSASYTSYIYDAASGQKLQVKFIAPTNIAASTTNGSVVAAVAARKIRVLSLFTSPAGTASACTFRSKPAGAGTDISSAITAGNPGVLPFSIAGYFETVAGEALTVTTGAGSTTGIGGSYVEVP